MGSWGVSLSYEVYVGFARPYSFSRVAGVLQVT